MISNRKVGGIRFIKIGRINISFSVSKPAPKSSKPDNAFPYTEAQLAGLVSVTALASTLIVSAAWASIF